MIGVSLYVHSYFPPGVKLSCDNYYDIPISVAVHNIAYHLSPSRCHCKKRFPSSINFLLAVAGISIRWIGISAFICQFIFGALTVYFENVPAPKGKNRVGKLTLLARGCVAALAIFTAILVSSTNGVVAGIVSTFPAIFLTTMVSVWWSQGQAVTTGAGYTI